MRVGFLRGIFGKSGPRVHVWVVIKGRIGAGWHDLDREVERPVGSTLGDLIAAAPGLGIPLGEALAESPHLRDTLMINGERCPVERDRGRVLGEGDEVYLLAPLAGG